MKEQLDPISSAIRAKLKADSYDMDCAHDLLINILGHFEVEPGGYLHEEVVTTFIDALTDSELAEIHTWGMSDTCVRDSIYVRITEDAIPDSVTAALVKHHGPKQ